MNKNIIKDIDAWWPVIGEEADDCEACHDRPFEFDE
jgi:hypothetical protein